MRVLLDACVLYPTVLREILIGVAATGAFVPLWSPRILEEWARAATRLGPQGERVARTEAALLAAAWPDAGVSPPPELERTLSLPDADDRHVLAAAIAGGAAELLTFNTRDFPTRTLGRHAIVLREPDGFLLELSGQGAAVAEVVEAVRQRTAAISGRDQPMRPLLKRASLPRLGKALG